MTHMVLETLGLFLSGMLAGGEFLVRYGLQPALTALPDEAHLRARQALIRQLRVLVPALMLPTVLVGVAVAVTGAAGPGAAFRWAGAATLIAFVLLSFLGTVPINIRVGDWPVQAPPSNWRAVLRLWARIDVFRSAAAMLAFACALIAAAQH